MIRFTYTVVVETPRRDQADQVMAERIGYDEDYGFEYRIGLAPEMEN